LTDRAVRVTAGHWAVLAGVLAMVLSVTLLPAGTQTAPGFARCIFCNPRMLSDSILNTALFVPVGLALRLVSLGPLAAAGVGVLVSVGIEVGQLWVPGRDPSASDIITNGAGAVLGAVSLRWFAAWVAPPRTMAVRLSVAAALCACAIWWATGWLVVPSMAAAEYWGQWTPTFGSLEPYGGNVTAAWVGGMPVPSHRVADSVTLRRHLVDQAPIDVALKVGRPPRRLSPIFSVADAESRRILLVGAAGDDLVYRYRTRAADWHFDQPDLRSPSAFAGVAPGAATTVTITTQAKGVCASVGGRTTCDLGFGPGDGWSLLVSSSAVPSGTRALLQALWMAAVVAPAGYWARRSVGSVAAVALLAAWLLVLPSFTDLLPTRPQEWGGAVVGFLSAALVASRWR